MGEAYPVVGVQGSGIQPRLEIRDLQNNHPIQFSLLVRAWNKLQEMKDKDPQSPNYYKNPVSWWELGGIHGLPPDPWTGDPNGPQKPDPKSYYKGYCYHSSILFPTWHRVSMLLVEQAVNRAAVEIATKTGDKEWIQAANDLRFPFWDWTRHETAKEGIPELCQEAMIKIVRPGGGLLEEVQNPMNHYRYAGEPGAAKHFEYMAKWGRTFRWVDNIENPKVEMYNMALEAFSKGLILHFPGTGGTEQLQPVHWLREKVAGLFDYPLTLSDPSYGPNLWGHFSTTASTNIYVPDGISEALANIEDSHNLVHYDTGGVGSMSINDYAGFDPIFYLHHCNVDRIYAFWEYVYPQYWMDNGWKNKEGKIIGFTVDEEGTFTQDPLAPVNHATSLWPFRTSPPTYWTSDNVRGLLTTSPTQKYYTYPVIVDPKTGVKVKVDEPYDVTNVKLRESYRQTLKTHWSQSITTTIKKIQDISNSTKLNPQIRRHLLEESEQVVSLRDFIIIGKVPEFAFAGSYRLELYLLSSVTKETAPQVINSVSVLARGDPEKCEGCKDRLAVGNLIHGYMRLDPILILHLIGLYQPATENPKDRWPNLPLPGDTGLLDDEHHTLEWLTNLIKLSLGVRLVRLDRKPLAVADPTIGANETLEEAKKPHLTLHSRRVRVDPTSAERDTNVPLSIDLEEAVNHGRWEVEGGWKAL